MSNNARMLAALNNLRQQIASRQQARRNERIAKGKSEREIDGEAQSVGSTVLSADVQGFFGMVMATVSSEKRRYFPGAHNTQPPAQAAPAAAPAMDRSAAAQENLASVPIHDLVLRGPMGGMPAAPMETAVAAPVVEAAASSISTVHLKALVEGWEQVRFILPHVGGEHLNPMARQCYDFMSHELGLLTEEQSQKGGVPPALMAKMKQAVGAFADNRTSDCITLLKNALSGDPHNQTLLAMLSQLLYYMAANGQQTALPEARENAQRSIIFSDKIKPAKLALYRYLAMVTESAFSPEHTLEWLRETGFLDPQLMMTPQGLLATHGLTLRGWALLSQIPVGLWTEHEFRSLKTLMVQVVGGAAVYQAWFRHVLMEASVNSKLPLPEVEEMERLVNTAHAFYEECATALKQLPLRSSPHPWLLRVRYMNTMAQLTLVPNFDQVLCMIALTGQSHRENCFPDNEMRTLLDDVTLSYWQTWALVMTPFKDVRQPYLLPADETVRDAPLMTSCDNLLAALQEAEKQRLKANLWEDLKPWMTPWRMEHLLAVGTGSNKPRMRFTPNLIPYTHFYRRWQEPQPVSPLASEVIAETARRGSFASLFEVVAAFDGAMRLLDDPVHGMVAGQKRALESAKKHNPKKYAHIVADFGSSGGSFMIYLLPVAGIGALALIFQLSANFSQAIGLSLALLGLVGVVALNLKK